MCWQVEQKKYCSYAERLAPASSLGVCVWHRGQWVTGVDAAKG